MRKIGTKFAIVFGILLLIFSAVTIFRTLSMSRKHAIKLTSKQAALAMEFDLAIREYVGETIRPAMEERVGEDEFIPEAMSTSFVARSIFDKVRKKFPNAILKFSSNNPRNPANLAGPEERKIIEYFNKNPQVERKVGEFYIGNKLYYAHFNARRMKESCLRCHGDPADAPASLVARYGSTAGFHRTVGEVIALDTIAIPMDDVNAALIAEATMQSIISLITIGLLFGVLVIMFRLLVTRRLAAITRQVQATSTLQNIADVQPVKSVGGRDEIGVLAAGYNALVAKLHNLYASLEEKVKQRTSELANANELLETRAEELEKSRKIALNMMEDAEQARKAAEEANRQLEEATERSKQLAEAAETATQAKSEFLANMSHEIRTPMTAILGYADLMTDPRQNASERLNCLSVVRRNGKHLLELINDILDISRIEAGKFTIEKRPCSLPQVVAEVISMMRVRADERNISLAAEYTGELPETILSDPSCIRQTLINLVGNAVKFTETGGVRVIVSFLPRWRNEKPAVEIRVADTGVGIGHEDLERLFQSFVQADTSTSRKYGGSGLGLAITRHIVAIMDGEVTAQSVKGEGSVFTMTIPTGDLEGIRMLKRPAEAVTVEHVGVQTFSSDALAGKRILLAEDGEDNMRLIRAVLRKAGAEVVVAENGRAAVDKAMSADGPFDVILMDMQMPEMDGYQATSYLRNAGYSGPIIALTAHAMAGDQERCILAGCNGYLSKPIDREFLVASIREHLVAHAVSS